MCDNGTTNGAADPKCDEATVNVTVTPVDDPPGQRPTRVVAEDSDTGVLVDVKANDSVGPANESGQTLTITGVTQGAHGAVAVVSGQIRYTPTDADYFGSDSFTYRSRTTVSGDPLVNDFRSDTGTVNVTVTEVNDPPVAATDTASVAEDSASGVLIDVRANDSAGPANESGQTLTVIGVSGSRSRGSVSSRGRSVYPGRDFIGPATFTTRYRQRHHQRRRDPNGRRHGQRQRHRGQRPAHADTTRLRRRGRNTCSSTSRPTTRSGRPTSRGRR